uniref:Olfactory receptor n=1 Tax=Pelusios castaneus TaxID=367368 RepID=A0A8C8RP51_9SAUR
ILLGFGNLPGLQTPLFLLFLVIYIVTMAGNILTVALVVTDQHLHTPMYFFLGNLSCLETCYSSTILPRVLASLLTGDTSISFSGCITQLYFFLFMVTAECLLLLLMSYDRYSAICNPLHYTALMSSRICTQTLSGCWIIAFFCSTLVTFMMAQLTFCGPNTIDHFFCDFTPMLQLSCTDTSLIEMVDLILSSIKVVFISHLTFCSSIINHFFCDISPLLNLACTDMLLAEMVDFILALIMILMPLLVVVASYACIAATIIPSSKGKRKAFSTCSSHLAVVVLFYSTTLFTYARPKAMYAYNSNKLVSVLYTVVVPFLNPLIYCLRNKEVKDVLRKGVFGTRNTGELS